jgi:predicted TIM-barrel fold metal-dependent hydrolase
VTATDSNTLRYIDSDGHILEHPTGMPDYAPEEFRDRIWHIETDEQGEEWVVYNGSRGPANGLAAAGTAGLSDEERAKAFRGELRYTEVRPAAYNAKARLQDMDEDGIDLAVLYPTMLLGLQSITDVPFTQAQANAYNRWASDHTQEGEGRLFAAGAVPAMHHPEDVAGVADAITHAGDLPGMVSVFMRPNPTVEWKYFNDPVYDPIWKAASDANMPIALHPFLAPDLPGASQGLRIGDMGVIFSQALANPADVMASIMFFTAGGVLERFPDLKIIFLEANGGWIVPWLERLDHHCNKFQWEVPNLKMAPSEYFRRQCWISFDPDESMLKFTAESPLVGADRIIWASDYPHPDAKFPGVTQELTEALEGLSFEQQQAITSESAKALYGIG